MFKKSFGADQKKVCTYIWKLQILGGFVIKLNNFDLLCLLFRMR